MVIIVIFYSKRKKNSPPFSQFSSEVELVQHGLYGGTDVAAAIRSCRCMSAECAMVEGPGAVRVRPNQRTQLTFTIPKTPGEKPPSFCAIEVIPIYRAH
jgi:hypothetical protein